MSLVINDLPLTKARTEALVNGIENQLVKLMDSAVRTWHSYGPPDCRVLNSDELLSFQTVRPAAERQLTLSE